MTWGEFKKIVEAKGVTDDMKINYIDISWPYDEDEIDVEIDEMYFSVY